LIIAVTFNTAKDDELNSNTRQQPIVTFCGSDYDKFM